MATDGLQTTELAALASIPADPTQLLLYAVDLTEGTLANQSTKMPLTLLDSRYLETGDTAAFATAAQGLLADSAVQPGDLGSAAFADSSVFATAAQGALADTALQAAAIGVSVQAYDAGLAAITAFGRSLIDDSDAAAGRVTLAAAGTGVANTFTAAQTVSVSSTSALRVWDGTTEMLLVNTANRRLGIGIAPLVPLHVLGSNGEIRAQNVVTDLTTKFGRFTIAHRDNSEEPVMGFNVTVTTSAANALFGGGSSVTNTVTSLNFYSAANNTTTTGTEIMRGTIAGLRIEPGGVGGDAVAPLHVKQTSTTGAVPPVRLEQLDLSEDFIEFNGTIATGNPIEAVGAKTLTTTHFLRVSVNGSFVYIPCGTIA